MNQDWGDAPFDMTGWEDAPEAIPRIDESEEVTLRLPKKQVEILREFARRDKVSFDVLVKRWLDDRIRIAASVR